MPAPNQQQGSQGGNAPARTGETVTVASKLPHGLVLQLQQAFKVKQAVQGEIRDAVVHKHVGQRYIIAGVAPVQARLPNVDFPRLSEGFALTPGIPADFWEVWKAENADNEALLNGSIFAHGATPDRGKAERTGFEPIDPKHLPAEFRRSIQTADAA